MMKCSFPDFISFHAGSLAAKSLALNKNPMPDAAQRNPEICVNRALIIYHQMIQLHMRDDLGLETLLDLNGSIIDQGNGYWIKIEAWRVEADGDIPHGIRYTLSLHEPYGKRMLGYDNAHAVKPLKKFKYAGQRLPFDHHHRHVSDKGVPYGFESAYQLLEDFFKDVGRVLKEVTQS